MLSSALLLCASMCVVAPGDASPPALDWSRFRGPNGSGVSTAVGLPEKVGPDENLKWKIETGRGASSPIVSGDQLFVTSFDGLERSLAAYRVADGERLWSLGIPRERETRFTPPSGPATATPVTDGKLVFAFFPDAGLIAATVEGQELWRKPLIPPSSMHGIASSLVIAGDKLIVLADQLAESFVAAYDCASGDEVWRQERFNGFTGGYSTPAVYEPKDGPRQLLVFGPVELVAYNPDNGERLWWVQGVGNSPVGVPIVSGDLAIISEPVFEPLPFNIVAGLDRNQDGTIAKEEHQGSGMSLFLEKLDREAGNGDGALDSAEWDKSQEAIKGRGGLAAVELTGKDDVTKSHVKWTYKKAVPYITSVLLYDGLLYMTQDGGLVTTLDPATGDVLKRGRLKEGGGQFYASPVAADGKVFVINTEGQLTVLKAGREWQDLSFAELGEPAWATPAIANGRLFVRTEKSLWCFGS